MMNQEDIFKKIGQILSELNDQYQYLAQNPQELNDLELELFLANSNFLSDHVQIIKKINSKTNLKTLPEHTETHKVVPVVNVSAAPVEEKHGEFNKPLIEEEIFKIDKEPSSFEFILSDRTPSDLFEFEEKPVGEIFDRPLSAEEEEIIARKQKLREKIDQEILEAPIIEDDEIGPEPFLVAESPTVPKAGTSYPEQIELESGTEEREEETVAFKGKAANLKEMELEEAAEDLEEEKPEPERKFGWESAFVEKAPEAEKEREIEKAKEIEIQKEREREIERAQKIEKERAAEKIREVEKIREAEKTAEIEKKDLALPPAAAEPVIKPATLNDILAGNRNVNSNIGSSRAEIKDLKQSVSLNDKMLYIKDLFNGYNLAYAEAIDLLNKMPDFKSADHFLQHNYAQKNNWSAKQDTVDQFYELLNRRFPAK